MGRGLVRGAALLSACSLLLSVVSNAPLWLVLRIEIGQQLCWHGEGVWQSRVWFGSQPKSLGYCQDPLGIGSVSTYEAFCSNENTIPYPHDNSHFKSGMCKAVNTAKPLLTLCCLALAMLTVIAGMFQHKTRMTKPVLVLCIALSALTVALPMWAWFVMEYSPLFSDSHREALSTQHKAGIPFGKFSGCSLTSPLHSIKNLILPANLHCLFPGPSYFATLLIGLLQCLAMLFLACFYIELSFAERASELLPSSMYGVLVIRTKHMQRGQFLCTTILPFACVVSHMLVWFAFVVYGVQIINTVEFIWRTRHGPDHSLFTNTLNGFNFSPELSVSYFWNNGARAIASLCFFAMLIAPVGKSMLWIILFYSPCNARIRGWVLTFLDLTGKVQMTYLFVLAVQAICSSIDSELTLLHFGRGESVVMRFVVGFTWTGVGTRLLVGSIVWSLILGQCFLVLHERCMVWEGKTRRDEEEDRDCVNAMPLEAMRNESVSNHMFQFTEEFDLQWTLRGKLAVSLVVVIVLALFAYAQVVILCTVKQTDALTLVIPVPDRTKQVSIIDLSALVRETGWGNGGKPVMIAGLLVLGLTVMPLVRILIAFALWLVPMPVWHQKRAFDILEITAAWSSLEIFLITLVACSREMAPLTEVFSGGMTPNLNEIVKFVFPMFHGMLGTEMQMHYSNLLLACGAVLLEKLMAWFFMSQAVVCIAERKRGGGAAAAEPLILFSPADRYAFRATGDFSYAGLPRAVWLGLVVRLRFAWKRMK